MADEKIIELLSRYLDGDLDADGIRQIESRIESEPALQKELEAMGQIRRSVATLAATDNVPRELDSVIDPLLRGRPETVGARSWVRWLATAAAVVLGTTVVIEVNRRNPGPNIEHVAKATKERQQAESEDRFALAPLPTSSVPEEERPLGASDRLLASPVPEVELDDPPPLEVLGPLEQGDHAPATDDIAEFNRSPPATEMPSVAAEAPSKKDGDEQPAPSGAKMRQAPRGEDKLEAQEADREEARQSWDAAPPMGRGQLFVFIDGRSAWRKFIPSATCKPGRYAVRIVVADGAVYQARPVGGAASASPSQRLCAANLILDLEIEAVADGEYPAEVVVEPRGAER